MSVYSGRCKLAFDRAEQYAVGKNLAIKEPLGSGQDGFVVATKQGTALKAAFYEELYTKELKVYKRLLEYDVSEIRGFSIPKLINNSDDLWVIEMQIVSPPFILDFASGYVDQHPPYEQEVVEEWEVEQRENFGDDWDEVQSVIAVFRRYGIYLCDVNPRNFNFGKARDA